MWFIYHAFSSYIFTCVSVWQFLILPTFFRTVIYDNGVEDYIFQLRFKWLLDTRSREDLKTYIYTAVSVNYMSTIKLLMKMPIVYLRELVVFALVRNWKFYCVCFLKFSKFLLSVELLKFNSKVQQSQLAKYELC